MRLHRLSMTAFGPFADTQVVDFDALAAGGPFLLRGATGAGKSSVLDAVCYALYGMLPGSRPRNRLRSDHARPEVRTEVELEVTLGGRRLRIVRSPEQLRAKRRGSGTTAEKAQTLLSEWSAEPVPGPARADTGAGWRASSKSHQEVGAEILQLLGMSREQFCQVVLLPQGGFARFLHASAPERAELLGRLFDTARFGLVEDWLAKRRKEADDACLSVRGEIRTGVERLREAAGAGLGTELAATADLDTAALGWAAQLRVEARELLTVAEVGHNGALARRAIAAERAAEVQLLSDRQLRHRRAVLRSRELDAGADAQAAAAARLERARRAEAVIPLLTLHQQSVLAQRRAAEAERRSRAVLPERFAAAGVEALVTAERKHHEELGGLRALLADEELFRSNERQRRRWESERDDAEARRTEADEWLADRPAARQRISDALEQAGRAAISAEQLDGRLREARQRCTAAEQAEELAARLVTAEQQQRERRESANRAHETWLDLRQHRLDGMAAELAERLADGSACPVCGSAEHPAPARPGPAQVTPEQERSAELTHREAVGRAEEASAQLQQFRQQAASLAAVAGERSVAELRDEAERLATAHEEAVRTAAEGLRAQEKLDLLDHEYELRAAESSEAATLAAARIAGLESIAAEQQRLAEGLERGRAGATSVAERAAELAPLADRLAKAVTAVRDAAAAAHALAAAGASATAVAEREGFADLAEAAAAALSPADTAALRTSVERYGTELAQLRATLLDAELLAAVRSPEADPAADRSALDAAEESLRRAYASEQAARGRCAALDRLGAVLQAELRRLVPLAEAQARVSALAGLVAGTSSGNTYRMSLETYVLAARLEQVAAAAATRLSVMSQGRYTLAHTDHRAKGGGRSGLGLSVLDAWTGQERDTSTLSGGESFFASLALALGLADVVTDEAGGMPLDTLFIDEGFGSLDEETLEDVLTVLERLRERDRAVGIVSHVAELRGRFPSQLEVRKGRSGSTLRQHLTG